MRKAWRYPESWTLVHAGIHEPAWHRPSKPGRLLRPKAALLGAADLCHLVCACPFIPHMRRRLPSERFNQLTSPSPAYMHNNQVAPWGARQQPNRSPIRRSRRQRLSLVKVQGVKQTTGLLGGQSVCDAAAQEDPEAAEQEAEPV